ncbi:hypothetical protein HDV05_003209 [Chytridiales sp. JEL 0842]|nr:hypothetical protein HDV05_003209 [Chytridiales sp. JEL 0842]
MIVVNNKKRSTRSVPRMVPVLASFLIVLPTLHYLSTCLRLWYPSYTCTLTPQQPLNTSDLPYLHTGLPYFDFISCFITQFFAAAQTDKLYGQISMGLLAGPFLSILLLVGIESTRQHKSYTPLSSFALFGTLAQFIGVSIAFPLVWLPSFLTFYKAPTTQSPPAPLGPSAKIGRITIGIILFMGVCVVLGRTTGSTYHVMLVVFQYFPILLPVIWSKPLLSSASKQPAGALKGGLAAALDSSRVAVSGFKILQLLTTIAHWRSILIFLFTHPSPASAVSSFVEFVQTHPTQLDKAQLPSFFFLVETISLVFSIGLFVCSESGLEGLGTYLVYTLLMGPGGALMTYCMGRETKLGPLVQLKTLKGE